jgi:hypothetical protein
VAVDKEDSPFFMFSNEKGLEMGSFVASAGIPGILIQEPPAPTIDQPSNLRLQTGNTAHFVCKVEWRKENSMIRVNSETNN